MRPLTRSRPRPQGRPRRRSSPPATGPVTRRWWGGSPLRAPGSRTLGARTLGARTLGARLLGAGAVGLVLAVTSAACAGPSAGVTSIPGHPGRGARATVTHVVDGDTVELAFADGRTERARLLGIDTPETVKPDAPVECFGPEASAHVKQLLAPGTEVLLQRDTEARDRYGRLLVYAWRRSDGLFVNASLVAEGYARTLWIAPNDAHRADLSTAAADATAAGRGLWGACPPESPASAPGG